MTATLREPKKVVFTFRSRRETLSFAGTLSSFLKPGMLVLLSGGLGAGKTFFTRGLLRALGVSARVRVTSPTFSLIHEYEVLREELRFVLHADLYRLNLLNTESPSSEARESSLRGVMKLGLMEAREDGALLLVEWGNEFESVLGGNPAFTVHLEKNVTDPASSSSPGRILSLTSEHAEDVERAWDLRQAEKNTSKRVNHEG